MMIQATARTQDLYPDSDGKPMADNTKQYRWIVRLVSNLRQLLRGQTAFVAGDLLWYPVKVDSPPAPSQAPDAMVVLGRPDGDRSSYKQWEEEGVGLKDPLSLRGLIWSFKDPIDYSLRAVVAVEYRRDCCLEWRQLAVEYRVAAVNCKSHQRGQFLQFCLCS